MRKTENVTLDGFVYNITQLPTTTGMPLGHRLIRAIGPVVVAFLDKLPKGEPVSDDKLAGVVVDALTQLPTELLQDLAKAFIEQCKFQGAEQPFALPLATDYDDHFAGRYGSWLRWFIACARVNFSGFFSSSASSAGSAQPAPSPTPTL